MTDGSEPLACWNCAQRSADTCTCGLCGVWLVDLDSERVPPAARPLLALAKRWGIADDGYRSGAIARARRDELETILLLLHDDDAYDEIQRWLTGPRRTRSRPAVSTSPSPA